MKYCVFISYVSLGDTVESIPTIRAIRDMGYSVVLVIPEQWLDAFKTLNWIKFITYKTGEVKIFIKNDGNIGHIGNISDRLIGLLSPYKDHCCASPILLSYDLKDKMGFAKYFDLRNRFNKTEDPKYISIGKASDFVLGTLCKDFTLELGYEKSKSKTKVDNKKLPVGLCFGSSNPFRKLSNEDVEYIIEQLQDDYEIYLFGVNRALQTNRYKVKSVVNASQECGIKETLNYLEKMKIFITPDSGLLHCSIAMRIPTIMLPLQSRTPEPWMVTNPWYVPYLVSCKDISEIGGIIRNTIDAYKIG